MPRPPELGPGQHAPADNGSVHSYLVYPLTLLVWQDAASTSSSICCSVALFPAEHRLTQSGIGAQAVADGHVRCGAEHDAEHSAGKSLSLMPMPPQLGPGKHAPADNCSAFTPGVSSDYFSLAGCRQPPAASDTAELPSSLQNIGSNSQASGRKLSQMDMSDAGQNAGKDCPAPSCMHPGQGGIVEMASTDLHISCGCGSPYPWAPWASTLREGPVAHLLQSPCRSMLKYLCACRSLGQNTLANVGSGNSVDMGRKLLQMAQNAGQNTLHQVRVVPPCAACTVAWVSC